MQVWAVTPSRKTGSIGRPKGLFRISISVMSVAVQGQYTSGSFTRLGFWDGWRGKLLRDWTLTAALSAGSGSPLTPSILFPVKGTGITGPLRPNVTGAPLYVERNGGFLSAAAFEAPELGQLGNAGRNSITGPASSA